MLLQDKVALVVAGGNGVAHRIASLFRSEGAFVAVGDQEETTAERVARAIDASGRRAMGIAMDLTDEGSVEAAISRVVNALGGLDILVWGPSGNVVRPFVDIDIAQWRRFLSLQLDGVFLVSRAALRQMYKQRDGCILYLAAETQAMNGLDVIASHALDGIAKAVAREGAAFGVCANLICSGRVGRAQAEMPGHFEDEELNAEKLAEVALFLAGLSSKALTGQALVVGGQRFTR